MYYIVLLQVAAIRKQSVDRQLSDILYYIVLLQVAAIRKQSVDRQLSDNSDVKSSQAKKSRFTNKYLNVKPSKDVFL